MINAQAAEIAGEWYRLGILLNQPKSIYDLILLDYDGSEAGPAHRLPNRPAAVWPSSRRAR